jgi:hypothetical protein
VEQRAPLFDGKVFCLLGIAQVCRCSIVLPGA